MVHLELFRLGWRLPNASEWSEVRESDHEHHVPHVAVVHGPLAHLVIAMMSEPLVSTLHGGYHLGVAATIFRVQGVIAAIEIDHSIASRSNLLLSPFP